MDAVLDAVLHHQTQADRFLALADADAKAGYLERSAEALERAVSHSAAAAGIHWGFFPRPTYRQIGHILNELAYNGHISHISARSFYKFDALRHFIVRSLYDRDRPAARRARRNTHRRVARIIYSINRAIAADPHPSVATPEPVEHWTINDGRIVHPTLAPPQPDQ